MINSFWEEQGMSKNILDFHAEVMKEAELPEWMNKLICPFCKEILPPRCIRSVGMKFNTRNYGDVIVEVFCEKCRKMDTLYFVKETNNIKDFVKIIDGTEMPKSKPVIEESMYNMKYNNIMEKMIAKELTNVST